MNRKGLGYVLGFAGMLCFIGLTSCAHDQQLTSITVQPATENFGASDIPVNLDAGLNVQLRNRRARLLESARKKPESHAGPQAPGSRPSPTTSASAA